MTNTTSIKITATTNRAASDAWGLVGSALAGVTVESAKHNGGKTVIVTIPTSELAAAEAALDAAHNVAAYEVR